MRKKLIIWSLLAVFLMLMLPIMPATETKIVQSATQLQALTSNPATYIDVIRAKYGDNPFPQCILLTLAIIVLKLLRWGIGFLTVGLILLIGGFLLILRILRQHNMTGLSC